MKTHTVLILFSGGLILLSSVSYWLLFSIYVPLLKAPVPNQFLIIGVFIGLGLMAIGIIAAILLSSFLVKPLRQLEGITFHSLNGEYQTIKPIKGCKEVQSLAQSLSKLIEHSRDAIEKLEESEEMYRTLFNLESDAIFLISNEDGSILAANDAASQMYGYSKELLLTFKNTDLSYEPEQTRTVTTQSPIQQDNIVFIPLRYHRKKDGTVLPVEITGRFFEWRGIPVHIAAIRDITERQQSQLLIQNQNDELQAQNEELLSQAQALRELENDLTIANTLLEQRVSERTRQLEAAVQELEAFAYSVSHDLRAPLRAIDGFCQMLMEDYLAGFDARGQHYIQRIRHGAQQMGQIIDDLLHLAHISRMPLQIQSINLSALVKNICLSISSLQPERKADFVIEENLTVNADLSLLRVALENLIRNAWKFTSKNDHTIIHFGKKYQNGETVYYLQDNGVGFNMEYSSKLFLPFQRLHTSQEFEGSGIGLAIVQRVIRHHGGSIWAVSEVNKGATFYFTLNPALSN